MRPSLVSKASIMGTSQVGSTGRDAMRWGGHFTLGSCSQTHSPV